ncbi:MAG: hypothetical protein R3286_00430 [Gammaproteobacteria bacterium]|nr:hypothetical protein [Gammaproteobacteria bacterium]
MSELNLTYGFVALCVALYAHERFTNPPVRAMTTAIQYHLAWLGYLVSTLVFFAGLSAVLKSNEALKFITMLTGAELSDEAKKLPAPFLAALFLTTLLPRMPLVKDLDARIQKFFRDLGEIPYKALGLSWRLRNDSFRVPQALNARVVERLRASGIEDADAMVERPADATESLWVKIVALVIRVQEEVESNRRPRFKRHQESNYDRILEAYARNAEVASVVFRVKGEQPLLAKKFHHDCRDLLREIADFISRGMLQSEYALGRAHRELGRWGFTGLENERSARFLSINQLIEVVLVLAVWMFLFFLFVGGRAADADPTVAGVLMKASAIALILGAAIACAIYPKCAIERAAGRAPDGTRPWAFYLLSALLAAGCWVIITSARLWLEGAPSFNGGDADSVLGQLPQKMPWMLMSVSTAFFTALMADNDPARWKVSEAAARWIEAAAMAVVLAATMFVVIEWLGDVRAAPIPGERIPAMLGSAAVVGFIIGFFAPTLYRRIPDRRRERERLSTDLEDTHCAPATSVPPRGDTREAA